MAEISTQDLLRKRDELLKKREQISMKSSQESHYEPTTRQVLAKPTEESGIRKSLRTIMAIPRGAVLGATSLVDPLYALGHKAFKGKLPNESLSELTEETIDKIAPYSTPGGFNTRALQNLVSDFSFGRGVHKVGKGLSKVGGKKIGAFGSFLAKSEAPTLSNLSSSAGASLLSSAAQSNPHATAFDTIIASGIGSNVGKNIADIKNKGMPIRRALAKNALRQEGPEYQSVLDTVQQDILSKGGGQTLSQKDALALKAARKQYKEQPVLPVEEIVEKGPTNKERVQSVLKDKTFGSPIALEESDRLSLKAAENAHKKASKAYSSRMDPIQERLASSQTSFDFSGLLSELEDQYNKLEKAPLKKAFMASDEGKLFTILKGLGEPEDLTKALADYDYLPKHYKDMLKDKFSINPAVNLSELNQIDDLVDDILLKYKAFGVNPKEEAIPFYKYKKKIRDVLEHEVAGFGEKELETFKQAKADYGQYKNEVQPFIKPILEGQYELGYPTKRSLKDFDEGSTTARIILQNLSPEDKKSYVNNILYKMGDKNGAYDASQFLNTFSQLPETTQSAYRDALGEDGFQVFSQANRLKKFADTVGSRPDIIPPKKEVIKPEVIEQLPAVDAILRNKDEVGRPFKASTKDMLEGATFPRFVAENLDGTDRHQYVTSILEEMGKTKGKFDPTHFRSQWDLLDPETKSAYLNYLPDHHKNSLEQGITRGGQLEDYTKQSPVSKFVAQKTGYQKVLSGFNAIGKKTRDPAKRQESIVKHLTTEKTPFKASSLLPRGNTVLNAYAGTRLPKLNAHDKAIANTVSAEDQSLEALLQQQKELVAKKQELLGERSYKKGGSVPTNHLVSLAHLFPRG